MKGKTIIIFFLILLLTGCSELIVVVATFVNIDSADPELKLHFDFKDFYRGTAQRVTVIKIYKENKLICKLESQKEDGITEWDFPSIPENFEIVQLDTNYTRHQLQKNENITFRFEGGLKFPGYGAWEYKTKYSKPEYRWLFDNKGNQKERIDCFYEPWIGKDIVKVESSVDFYVTDSLFSLHYQTGTKIEFELKYKRNPTNRVALILNHTIKKGEKIILDFKLDSIRNYKEIILVPDKSVVGVAGKFNDL